MAYTTDSLLSAIERASFSPENQSTYESLDILAIADEVLKTEILPSILSVREEFFVTYKDYPIVSGVSSYPIPPRAVGMIAREVQIANSDGGVKNLSRVSIDRLHMLSSTSGDPTMFYLRGNNVILQPVPSSTQNSLRIYYYIRPGSLIETSESAVISAIDTATNVVSVSSIPSTWVTGNIFDFTKKDGAHEYRGIDYTSTTVSGTDITFSTLPSDLEVGDYITLTGKSALVQLPPEFQPILVDLVAAEMLTNMSQPGGEKLYEKAQRRLQTAQKMITPRVHGEDEIILPDWD